MLLLLLACAGSGKLDDTSAVADFGDADTDSDTDTDTDADTDSDTDTDLPDGLNGVAPTSPIALPTFTAHTQYGDARSEADLVGHPTVLWFYPAAGTYG